VSEAVTIVEDGDAKVVISTERLPILVATWSGIQTVDLVDRYFDAHYALLRELDARGKCCVMVTLGLAVGRPSPIVRKRIVDRLDDDRELSNRVLVANAVVIENAIVRGAMVAMSWVDPSLRVPTFASEAEAFAWAEDQCAQAGLR
jgi:hypothetical protein